MSTSNSPGVKFSLLTGLIVLLVQYVIFLFTKNPTISLVCLSIPTLIGCSILLSRTRTYLSCFLYTLFLVVLDGLYSFGCYYYGNLYGLQYNHIYWSGCLVSFFIPCIYCYICAVKDSFKRNSNYKTYFGLTSLLFLLPYCLLFYYIRFVDPSLFGALFVTESNFIPFMTLSTYIEVLLQNNSFISAFFAYLFFHLILPAPLGFYFALLLRNIPTCFKVIIFLLLSVGLEYGTHVTTYYAFDIDNALFSFLGILIGFGCFSIVNSTYYRYHNRFIFSGIR